MHGSPRSYNAACTECGSRYYIEYTCEKCDYDICNKCFKEKTMTPAEKKAEAKRKAAQEKERQKAEAEERRLQEEEEAKRRKKWDPKTHFAEKIVNPFDKNKDPDGNKAKGFTVWCSDGYGNDGWHSYEGAPAKEFDTTYATKKEANDRARYLFQWNNPWGYDADEFNEKFIWSEKSTKTGLAICKEFQGYEHDLTIMSTKDGMVTLLLHQLIVQLGLFPLFPMLRSHTLITQQGRVTIMIAKMKKMLLKLPSDEMLVGILVILHLYHDVYRGYCVCVRCIFIRQYM